MKMGFRTTRYCAALLCLPLCFHAMAQTPVPTEKSLAPYAASPHAAAIDAGLKFLIDGGDRGPARWDQYALLDFLRRRFGLDACYAFSKTFAGKNIIEDDAAEAKLLGRMTDPSYRAPRELVEGEQQAIMRFMGFAMYCDVYPMPKEEVDKMFAFYDKGFGGYVATHVILACQWMKELGCDGTYPAIAAHAPLFADTLCGIVEKENAQTDVAFEAMAFLYYIGAGDRVRKGWVDNMLSVQRPDGAWAYAPEGPAHGHPTLLALWVLLEGAVSGPVHPRWLR